MRQLTPPIHPTWPLSPLGCGVLLAAVLWLGPWTTAGVFGQGSRWQSHGPIPGESQLKPTDLASRLKMAQEFSKAQQLLRESQNPQFLQQFLKDLGDPNQQAQLEEIIRAAEGKRIQLDPRNPLVKELEKILKNQGSSSPTVPGLSRELEQRLKDLLPNGSAELASGNGSGDGNPANPPNDAPAGPPKPAGPGNAAPPSETMTGLPPELEDPLRHSKFGEWMLRHLNDSPELRQTVEDLLRFRPRAGGGPAGGNTLADKVAHSVQRYLPESSFWTNKVLPKLSQITLPKLPNVHLPEIHVHAPALPSVHLPHVSLPSPPRGRAVYGWLMLPLGFIFGLIGWKILQERQQRADRLGRFRAGDRWVLGPWPVAPNAVSSEAELIQAFEHLTLLKLGPEARSWNHHAIAAGLGGAHPERRRAADQLAALYEQFRYAPIHPPLAADILHSARRALTFLAEGTPA